MKLGLMYDANDNELNLALKDIQKALDGRSWGVYIRLILDGRSEWIVNQPNSSKLRISIPRMNDDSFGLSSKWEPSRSNVV
jgi:hypothetical protein